MARQSVQSGTVTTTVNYDIIGPDEIYNVGTVALYRDRPFDVKQVQVTDFRGREKDFSLNRQGWELHEHDLKFEEFEDDERTRAEYWPAVAELLRTRVGASKVVPFSHIHRKRTYESVEAEAKKEGPDDKQIPGLHPARWVHIDQSPKGAEIVGEEIFKEDWPTLSSGGRWGIINVWQPLNKVVRKDPLGMIDRTTVDKADLVTKYLAPPVPRPGSAFAVSDKKLYEANAVKSNPDHRWYYCSGLRREEVLFLRIFDSRDDGGLHGIPHTSFIVPGTENEENRQSVETRCFVFW